MRNILVTDYDNVENVLIMNTELTADQIKTALDKRQQTYTEVYEIREDERQYYIFDPLYADKTFDNDVLQVIEAA